MPKVAELRRGEYVLPVRVTSGSMKRPSSLAKAEGPSVFACPECHGVLWEGKNGNLVRYPCRLGHTEGKLQGTGRLCRKSTLGRDGCLGNHIARMGIRDERKAKTSDSTPPLS
jgi:hypothetical protein